MAASLTCDPQAPYGSNPYLAAINAKAAARREADEPINRAARLGNWHEVRRLQDERRARTQAA